MAPDIVDLPLLLDLLALGVSALLIVFLIVNRRRYGHLLATPQHQSMNFNAEMTAQMLTQQSQRSYHKIQKTLNQEFANLQRIAGGDGVAWSLAGHGAHAETSDMATADISRQSSQVYDEAARMIRNGADHQVVAQRCGLSRAEVELITYLQQKPS